MQFFILFTIYIVASVASQFLTSTPIDFGTFMGVPIWMPLSAFTLVPLVDVMRSFTQDAAEERGMTFKTTFRLMFVTSMVAAGLCVIFAGLPLPIFVGVLSAITIGGALDIIIFKHMGKFFKLAAARMMFSNFAATIVGSGIVFFIAFTDWFFVNNSLARPIHEVVVGWLVQSLFIWASGSVIAWVLQWFKSKRK